jgi:hypothetical protein
LICEGLKVAQAYEVTLEAENLRRIVLNLARTKTRSTSAKFID